MAEFFVNLALNVPLNQCFTYRCTLEGEEAAKAFGRRVQVPFGSRRLSGVVVGVSTNLPPSCSVPQDKVRAVTRFIDADALLTEELYALARWINGYYIAPIGEVIFAMLPSGRKEMSAGGFSFAEDGEAWSRKALSAEQQAAVDGILHAASGPAPGRTAQWHYLYGMTGSGKTEVFLSAAESVLAQGKGVIYLVPEIGLTPQVSRAVIGRFGDTAAILHSGLTPSQRLGEWRRILTRQARVVIGARSAVFAPVPDLGLVIIDEEHDGSYKSGSSPRYHARQVAMQRCRTLGIPLVMGSATPSVEAYRMMQEGLIMQHRLSRRLAGGSLPRIECVNLSAQTAGDGGSISPRLEKAVKDTLAAQKQTILFLNRRGFTNFFRCNGCGFELKCRNCSVTLTYHKADNRLKCHYCGYSVEPPHQCPRCGSLDVGYIGFGTEFVENEVRAKFPNARVIRVDSDNLKGKDELQEHLDAFRRGDYDILLGTQVVAKGLNFPRLRLVGVILADSGLHLPDFRAAERTFALITQVAGRAGRFSGDGQVIVQSYSPDMPPIALAVRGEVDAFYRLELEQRSILSFPPYTRLLRLVFRSASAQDAQKAAEGAAQILAQDFQHAQEFQAEPFELLGPSPCPLELIAGNWRWQIILRGKKMPPLQRAASSFIGGYAAPRHVYIEVDVDPVNLL